MATPKFSNFLNEINLTLESSFHKKSQNYQKLAQQYEEIPRPSVPPSRQHQSLSKQQQILQDIEFFYQRLFTEKKEKRKVVEEKTEKKRREKVKKLRFVEEVEEVEEELVVPARLQVRRQAGEVALFVQVYEGRSVDGEEFAQRLEACAGEWGKDWAKYGRLLGSMRRYGVAHSQAELHKLRAVVVKLKKVDREEEGQPRVLVEELRMRLLQKAYLQALRVMACYRRSVEECLDAREQLMRLERQKVVLGQWREWATRRRRKLELQRLVAEQVNYVRSGQVFAGMKMAVARAREWKSRVVRIVSRQALGQWRDSLKQRKRVEEQANSTVRTQRTVPHFQQGDTFKQKLRQVEIHPKATQEFVIQKEEQEKEQERRHSEKQQSLHQWQQPPHSDSAKTLASKSSHQSHQSLLYECFQKLVLYKNQNQVRRLVRKIHRSNMLKRVFHVLRSYRAPPHKLGLDDYKALNLRNSTLVSRHFHLLKTYTFRKKALLQLSTHLPRTARRIAFQQLTRYTHHDAQSQRFHANLHRSKLLFRIFHAMRALHQEHKKIATHYLRLQFTRFKRAVLHVQRQTGSFIRTKLLKRTMRVLKFYLTKRQMKNHIKSQAHKFSLLRFNKKPIFDAIASYSQVSKIKNQYIQQLVELRRRYLEIKTFKAIKDNVKKSLGKRIRTQAANRLRSRREEHLLKECFSEWVGGWRLGRAKRSLEEKMNSYKKVRFESSESRWEREYQENLKFYNQLA